MLPHYYLHADLSNQILAHDAAKLTADRPPPEGDETEAENPAKRSKWDDTDWGSWQSNNWADKNEWLRSSKATVADLESADIPFNPPPWWPHAAELLIRASPAWIRTLVSLHVIEFKSPASLKQSLALPTNWWDEKVDKTLANAISLPSGLSLVQRQDASSILVDLTTILSSASTVHTAIWSPEFKSALVDPTEKGIALIEREALRLVNNRAPDFATFAQGLATKFQRVPVIELLCHLLNTRQAEVNGEIKIKFHTAEMHDLAGRISTVLAAKDPRHNTTKQDLIYALALIVAQVNTQSSSLSLALRGWGSSHAQRHVAQAEFSTILLAQSASWPLSTTSAQHKAAGPPGSNHNARPGKWTAADWKEWNYSQQQLKGWPPQDKGGNGWPPKDKGGKNKGKGKGSASKGGAVPGPLTIVNSEKYKSDFTPTGYMLYAYEQTIEKNPSPSLLDVSHIYNKKCPVNGQVVTAADVKRLLLSAKKTFNIKGKYNISDWE